MIHQQLDFSVSTVQDMLSSGAKEFIARHGGTAAAGNVFGLLAITSNTLAGTTAAANVNAINAGNSSVLTLMVPQPQMT